MTQCTPAEPRLCPCGKPAQFFGPSGLGACRECVRARRVPIRGLGVHLERCRRCKPGRKRFRGRCYSCSGALYRVLTRRPAARVGQVMDSVDAACAFGSDEMWSLFGLG